MTEGIGIIPNNLFVAQAVQNETFNAATRMNLVISVSLKEDIKIILKILIDVTDKQNNVFKYPEPFVTFDGYGEYTYDFMLRALCSRVDKLI